jgi:hypothetical protein
MKRKCTFMSITMAIIVLVSLYTVCASISVGAVNSGGANVQSALVGAPAGVVGAPAVCSQPGTNSLDLFVRGNDNALYWRHVEGGVWGAWVNLGGYWTSDPSATSPNSGSVVVCARGDDGAFWWNYVMDGGVTAPQWYSSGGQLLTGTGAAAFSSGEWDGEWACFAAVGTNHQLYWYTTSSTWQSLGGYLTASPAGASTSAGVFDVFARGSNGALYEKTSTNGGGTWGAWASLGGQLASGTGPAVCSWGSGRLDVFVQGTDGALWHKWWNGAKWSGWESLGGKLTSSPTAASRSSGTIDVFVRGTDNNLWKKTYSGGWSGWTSVSG